MIRVVTRKSQLAQRQTAIAINALSSLYTDIDFKIMPVTAQGDDQRHQRFLKGGFTKTLEESLMSGFADIAIHSLKDLSVDNTPSLIVGGVLKRTEPRDVFVSIDYPDIASMPQGTLVGTCSPRRAAIINHYYPWLNVVDCRGDVLTRIEKLKSETARS